MKKFLAVYTGTADGVAQSNWDALTDAERNARQDAGMDAWMSWGGANAAAVVDHGGPLGKTKRVSPEGIADVRNNLAGYTIVQAESHEAAAKMFENHPHFSIFPGDAVEIMELMPIPQRPKD